MNPEIEALITKARRSLAAGNELLAGGHPDFAASRAYYSMFYLAEALLLTRGLRFAKHGAVLGNLAREFVKTGLIPTTQFKAIRKAFEARTVGDYDPLVLMPAAEARAVLDEASAFLTVAEGILRQP